MIPSPLQIRHHFYLSVWVSKRQHQQPELHTPQHKSNQIQPQLLYSLSLYNRNPTLSSVAFNSSILILLVFMSMATPKKGTLNGFSPISSTPVFWKSRKRSASIRNVDKATDDTTDKTSEKGEEFPIEEKNRDSAIAGEKQVESPIEGAKLDSSAAAALSERRKALFEPLEPNINGKRPSAESLLPPPDFDSASYPRGWLIGKKRKLVNVDVVESMRRIAIQEMNRKDREIDGLNEQLEGDARVLEHLQIQLLEERSKRSDVERENAMLQNQINMLMDMLQENEAMDEEDRGEQP